MDDSNTQTLRSLTDACIAAARLLERLHCHIPGRDRKASLANLLEERRPSGFRNCAVQIHDDARALAKLTWPTVPGAVWDAIDESRGMANVIQCGTVSAANYHELVYELTCRARKYLADSEFSVDTIQEHLQQYNSREDGSDIEAHLLDSAFPPINAQKIIAELRLEVARVMAGGEAREESHAGNVPWKVMTGHWLFDSEGAWFDPKVDDPTQKPRYYAIEPVSLAMLKIFVTNPTREIFLTNDLRPALTEDMSGHSAVQQALATLRKSLVQLAGDFKLANNSDPVPHRHGVGWVFLLPRP
jgi:hypothetical protein